MKEVLKRIFGAITEEQIKQFHEELGKRFVSKADFNSKLSEIASLKEALSGAETGNAMVEQLAAMQKRYDEETELMHQEMDRLKFDHAVELALAGSHAKNTKAVRALLDTKSLSLGENGVEGLSEQLAKIRKENGYLFEDIPMPGLGGRGNFARAGGPSLSREEFQKMNYAERMALFRDNRSLYEQLTGQR